MCHSCTMYSSNRVPSCSSPSETRAIRSCTGHERRTETDNKGDGGGTQRKWTLREEEQKQIVLRWELFFFFLDRKIQTKTPYTVVTYELFTHYTVTLLAYFVPSCWPYMDEVKRQVFIDSLHCKGPKQGKDWICEGEKCEKTNFVSFWHQFLRRSVEWVDGLSLRENASTKTHL